MERLFINNNFKYVHLIPISNGTSWTIDALCRRIETLYKASGFFGDGIFVWLDREDRAETSTYISSRIKEILVAAGAPESQLGILICDRMTENLILSDVEMMREYTGNLNYEYDFDGLNGARYLKEILILGGKEFKKIPLGVELLKRMRISRAAARNGFSADFVSKIPQDCWWR